MIAFTWCAVNTLRIVRALRLGGRAGLADAPGAMADLGPGQPAAAQFAVVCGGADRCATWMI